MIRTFLKPEVVSGATFFLSKVSFWNVFNPVISQNSQKKLQITANNSALPPRLCTLMRDGKVDFVFPRSNVFYKTFDNSLQQLIGGGLFYKFLSVKLLRHFYSTYLLIGLLVIIFLVLCCGILSSTLIYMFLLAFDVGGGVTIMPKIWVL